MAIGTQGIFEPAVFVGDTSGSAPGPVVGEGIRTVGWSAGQPGAIAGPGCAPGG
jgi:hypothetical protein